MALIVHSIPPVSPDQRSALLIVRLAETAVGLPAQAVREIVRAVAITPVAGAPPIFEGAVNVRGQLVPVVDVRRRLELAPRELHPDEFMVVFAVGPRTFAMRVDDVDDVVDVDDDSVTLAPALSPGLRGLAGLVARSDGVLVIHDPDAFVTQAEAEAVDAALALHP